MLIQILILQAVIGKAFDISVRLLIIVPTRTNDVLRFG